MRLDGEQVALILCVLAISAVACGLLWLGGSY